MSRRTRIGCVTAAFLLLLAAAALFTFPHLGVDDDSLVSDARKSQHIADSDLVSIDANDTLGALLFYPADCTSHTFSVYLNSPGFSFGYFFRQGGSLSSIENGVYAVETEGALALLSMNVQGVSDILCQSVGRPVYQEHYAVSPDQPFAVVVTLPEDLEVALTLTDRTGAEISISTYATL